MPYRVALETTLARCAELAKRIRALEGALGLPLSAVGNLDATDYNEACALEARLATRVAELEEEIAQRHVEENGVVGKGSGEVAHTMIAGDVPSPIAVYVGIVGLLGLGVLVVLNMQPTNVVSASGASRSRYHTSGHTPVTRERCSISFELERDACNVSVLCETIVRRAHSDDCISASGAISVHVPGQIDFDGQRGTARLINDSGESFDIELDELRF